jgi:hypothetical protein
MLPALAAAQNTKAPPPAAKTTTLKDQADAAIQQFPKDLQSCYEKKVSEGAAQGVAVDTCLDQQTGTYVKVILAAASEAAVKNATATLMVAADEARPDKQLGAGASSSGSTSLTSKGSVPDVLGFAVENGALVQSASGTAITFSARPLQLVQALQKTGWVQSYKDIENNPTLGILNRFSFGVTFDTTRGGTNGVFTGSTNQVSAFLAHVDLLNWRDPRSKRFDPQWEKLRAGALQEMSNKIYAVLDKVFDDPAFQKEYDTWKKDILIDVTRALTSKDASTLANISAKAFTDFPPASVVPGAEAIVKSAADATTAVLTARQNILDYVGTAPIISFEYTDNLAVKAVAPSPQLPDISNLKLIVEAAPFHGGSFTLNGSATIFNSPPVGFAAKRLRDAQASAQLDVPIKTVVSTLGNVLLSFSGRFEHIASDTLPTIVAAVPGAMNLSLPSLADVFSGTGAALKGNLGLFQAKLTIPVKNSGVKIPLSVTWANRTELIKESDVRGNIGVTFDMDTIVGSLKK